MPPPLLPRGLIRNAPGATPGYVLFNPSMSDAAYLVDNEGRVVHVWKTPYAPGGDLELLPNGNLLRGARDPEMLGFKTGGTGGILQELAWDGSVVWEWKLSSAERMHHHDVTALPNGNVLLLAWEVKSPEQARRAGRRVEQIPEQGLWPDLVLEIEPVRPRGANVVWEWHVWDHLIQSHDPAAENHGDPAAHPGRIDLNAGAHAPAIDAEQLEQLKALGYVPADATPQDLRSDFLHVNAVTYHPRLDQIALSVPMLGEIWIIDHATTTAEAAAPPAICCIAGATRRRMDAAAKAPACSASSTSTTCAGSPTAGRARAISQSSTTGASGPTARGLRSTSGRRRSARTDAMRWTAAPSARPRSPGSTAYRTSFYAPFVSGAHRLPNGNTMICSGTGGQFLEVTRAGEVVWEYRNPFWGDVRNVDGSLPQPRIDERPFATFRAARIPADHPGLAGARSRRSTRSPRGSTGSRRRLDGAAPEAGSRSARARRARRRSSCSTRRASRFGAALPRTAEQLARPDVVNALLGGLPRPRGALPRVRACACRASTSRAATAGTS